MLGFVNQKTELGGPLVVSTCFTISRAADGSIAIETVNYSAVPHPDVPPMKWQEGQGQKVFAVHESPSHHG